MVGGKSLKIPNAEDGLAIVIFVNLIIVNSSNNSRLSNYKNVLHDQSLVL